LRTLNGTQSASSIVAINENNILLNNVIRILGYFLYICKII